MLEGRVWTAISLRGQVHSGRFPAPAHHVFLNNHNVYYTVNDCDLPVGTRKPTRHDVTHIRGLLFDFDPINSHISSLDSIPISAYIDVFEFRPRLPFNIDNYSTINSGRGLQYVLNIQPHKPVHEPDWYEARHREALRDWCARNLLDPKVKQVAKLDISCTDLARLARLPATINHKTGRTATVLSRGLSDITPAEYEDWLSQYTPVPRLTPQPVDVTQGGIPAVLDALTITARSWIYDGAELGRRHHKAFACAANLIELGIPHDISLYLLLQGDRLCTNPLNQDELTRIYRNAHLKVLGTYPEKG